MMGAADMSNMKIEKMQSTDNIIQKDIIELTKDILLDTCVRIPKNTTITVPIAKLATLGAGVSSLIPVLNTVTQTTTIDTNGLFRIVNFGVEDTLKIAKNGNYWGALKGADGKSKLAQLQAAGPFETTTKAFIPINPAMIMMAAALFSIEQKLDDIEETQKKIITFLEREKESEIEADVEILVSMISKYKYNWDNEYYIQSNHKMVLDLQRTARKNILLFQKNIENMISIKKKIISQSKISSTMIELIKNFRYYRLALYTFSLASFLEILLSGNFMEEYIEKIKIEIENFSMEYRELFGRCSALIEKLCESSVEINLTNKLGNASDIFGKIIGNIPKIKDGNIDEYFQAKGISIKNNADAMERNMIMGFSEISNPGVSIFTEKMKDISMIYNHTADIAFDSKNIYLMAG